VFCCSRKARSGKHRALGGNCSRMGDVFGGDGPGYIELTVRTLSGTEIHFPQVCLGDSVLDLKRMIFAKNSSFPTNEQKLIKVRWRGPVARAEVDMFVCREARY